jgi:hypothetical protein
MRGARRDKYLGRNRETYYGFYAKHIKTARLKEGAQRTK